ncbi:hypothetical protein I4F81_003319 [Pyropia yezoensis]|uniref:Uncharacterized protein n=1 Tax=Pyropia yezoensis TaxID=2788 RepID=A0ACC3BRV7_PYRYE|nr:hypothetical protein I4F81_003319 [Neopyropia yezoensis]
MTTAHRATYKPARGATASAGRALVRSAAVSGRDGVNHTVLKKRDRLPLGASLGSDEEDDDGWAPASGGDAATGAIGGLVDVGAGTGAGAPLWRRKRPALLAATRAEEVAAAAARYAEADADRRWDDDLVFRHQTRGQVAPPKRFINDTVRNDFHRRFLDKYIR